MQVVVGWLHNGHVVGDFCKSLVNLIAASRQMIYGQIVQAGSSIVMGRNTVVEQFLGTEAEWLFMVDSDMTFEPDSLVRLLAAADPKLRPVVGGLCFGMRNGEVFPTIFAERDGEMYVVKTWPENTVTKVSATGAAFLLVHRSVFVKMAERFAKPCPWFADEVLPSGELRGEDVTFCVRAESLGFPIFVHTGVKVGHVKQHTITEDTFRG